MFECENNYKLEVYHHPHYICQIVPKNINFFTINKYRNHLERGLLITRDPVIKPFKFTYELRTA